MDQGLVAWVGDAILVAWAQLVLPVMIPQSLQSDAVDELFEIPLLDDGDIMAWHHFAGDLATALVLGAITGAEATVAPENCRPPFPQVAAQVISEIGFLGGGSSCAKD
jgi:hypothetical protein